VNLRRNFERYLLGAQLAVDALSVFVACLGGFALVQAVGGYGTWLRLPPPAYWPLFFWIVGVSLSAFAAFGMYSTRKSLLNVVEFGRLGKSTLASFIVVTALIFLLRAKSGGSYPTDGIHALLGGLYGAIAIETEDISRGMVVYGYALLFVLVAAERFVFFKIVQEAHRRGIGRHHVLIVGAGISGQKVREKLIVSPTIGWNLRGYLDDEAGLVGTRIAGVPVLGTLDDLERLVPEMKVRTVFVSIPESDETRILEMVRRCRALGTEVCVVPRLWHLLAFPVQIDRLDSIPLIVPRRNVQRWTVASGKRAIDLVVAAAALLLLSPLFLVIPFLIRRESEGPAFFRQRRVGKDGRLFWMLKFRTMHSTISRDALKPQRADDPRITALGRLLRRTSIDEVPQFWNVLMGDMSLVGPRPEMPFIVDAYSEAQRARLAVKPGITGLWQISYARLRPIHANLDYDLFYVENQSLLLDLVILFLTPFAMLKGTGAH